MVIAVLQISRWRRVKENGAGEMGRKEERIFDSDFHSMVSFFFLCSTRDWTRCLVLSRQALMPQSYILGPQWLILKNFVLCKTVHQELYFNLLLLASHISWTNSLKILSKCESFLCKFFKISNFEIVPLFEHHKMMNYNQGNFYFFMYVCQQNIHTCIKL